MKPLYDATTVMLTLRDGINKGYWTLEDLDVPPPGYIGTPENFRNLLRDDFHPEAVQAAPDPRDFAESKPTLRRTEPQIFNPEPTDQGMGTGAVERDSDLLAHNEPSSQECDREGQAELVKERSTDSPSTGESLDW